MDSSESFDDLMVRLRSGDDRAAAQIFERFAGRLIGLANRRLDQIIRSKVDPEDVVQSALKSFFRKPDCPYEFHSWDDLWALLARITLRKCGHRVRHFRAERRDVRREIAGRAAPDDGEDGWRALARDPEPSEAAMLVEIVETVLRTLSERDRQVFVSSLQGHSIPEISAELQCTERTVYRALEFIRGELTAMQTA